MNYQITTEEEIKLLSAPMIGSNNGALFQATDYQRFKAKFGVTPDVYSLVWNKMIERLNNFEPTPGFSLISPVHILYALLFLRVYPTVRQAVGTLGCSIGTNQFGKYFHFVIKQIAGMHNDVVSNNILYYSAI